MGQPTIKGEIVLEYLKGQFKDLPTKTLARKIYNENNKAFRDVEDVRLKIRYYTQNLGVRNRSIISKDHSDMKKGKAENAIRMNVANPFHLPESDEGIWEPFMLPKKQKLLILSDIHLPFHNIEAISVALEEGQKQGVNAVLLNGDTLDCYQLSRYEKDPRKRRFSEELEIGREFLRTLKKSFNMPIYFKIGNHEARYESFLRLKAPELLDVSDLGWMYC